MSEQPRLSILFLPYDRHPEIAELPGQQKNHPPVVNENKLKKTLAFAGNQEYTCSVMRIHLDPDFRRQPKTDRFCCMCQKDLKPGSGFKIPITEDWMCYDTESQYTALIGKDCAKKHGIKTT